MAFNSVSVSVLCERAINKVKTIARLQPSIRETES